MEDRVLHRIKMLNDRVEPWKNNPAGIPADTREEISLLFASTFKEFTDFAEIGMVFLGFRISPMQASIARYMQYGSRRRMVEAQRGEAKTTLAALYAVWCLIQDPTYRVLIVSAGETQSNDIAVLIIRLIEQWPLLCWLKADTTAGDRTSYEHYDVHYSLRRVEKSASISSAGIKANLPGKRADLILADDVESYTNSNTQVMRDDLLNRTKEFAPICTHGHIMYLGTPQSRESIYKTLLSRGFEIRIWPGRYPEPSRLERYLPNTLAPEILEDLAKDPSLGSGGGIDGTRGKPTDTIRYTEEELQEKELDLGPEDFDLQYMLDTTLADEERTKIKLSDFIVASTGYEEAPETFQYSAEPRLLVTDPELSIPPIQGFRMYHTARASSNFKKYDHKVMVVDPAGNGGDEVAYACGGACNSYVHLFSVGGLRGGMSQENIGTIIDLCVEFGINTIRCESNMGHGTVEALFIAELANRKLPEIGVEGFYNSIQKEKRIIDTVSPVTRRHKLIIHERAIRDDWKYCLRYSSEKRTIVCALYQLANITYDRNSLAKDDRADAVAEVIKALSVNIAYDDAKVQEKRSYEKSLEFSRNPMGYSNMNTKGKKKWNNLNKFSHVRKLH